MWVRMYLRFHNATAKIEDGCDATCKPPELPFPVPLATRRLNDRVQRLLMWLRLDEDHFRRASSNWLAAHDELNSRVTNLALGVGPMTYADQRVSVAARQFDRSAVCWRQGLDDAVSAAFRLHRL
jgi:hypothetical protein